MHATPTKGHGGRFYPDGPGPFAVTILRHDNGFPVPCMWPARERMARWHGKHSACASAKVVLKSRGKSSQYWERHRLILLGAAVYHVTRRMR